MFVFSRQSTTLVRALTRMQFPLSRVCVMKSQPHSSLSTHREKVLQDDENVSWHFFSAAHHQTVVLYYSASSGRSALPSDESLAQSNSHMLLACSASHVGSGGINWSQCPHNVQRGATRQGGDRAAWRHLKSPWVRRPLGEESLRRVLNFLFFLSLSHSCSASSWLNDSSLSDCWQLVVSSNIGTLSQRLIFIYLFLYKTTVLNFFIWPH